MKFNLFLFVFLAKGAFQKEVVQFGLAKQEVALLQKPTGETSSNFNTALCIRTSYFKSACVDFVCFINSGCWGVRGHFHRHREQQLLCWDVCPEARSGEQVEVWHQGGDAWARVHINVWAGEGAERVGGRPEEGAVQAHVTSGYYWWAKALKVRHDAQQQFSYWMVLEWISWRDVVVCCIWLNKFWNKRCQMTKWTPDNTLTKNQF